MKDNLKDYDVRSALTRLKKKDRLNNITVPVTDEMKEELESMAAKLNSSRGEFMRVALEYALNSREFIKIIDELSYLS